jgi:hypothetical protein
MLQLRAAKGPTGRLLQQMLRDKGLLSGKAQAVVNYGYAEDSGLPTLNRNAGRVNKFEELCKLDDAGVRVVPFSDRAGALEPPVFGRRLHHSRGTDILVYHGAALARRSDYYTQFIPKTKEFRVWVFRDKALATYEKVLTYAERNGRRGQSKDVWNWANGYAYTFISPDTVPDVLKRLATAAVKALDLDFGAVDTLLGEDRKHYVLEVNTAPGTQGQARQGVTSLVNCIDRWARAGFQARG